MNTSDDSYKRGLSLALCSVALVAVAQLLLKFGVAHVPLAAPVHDFTQWLGSLSITRAVMPLALGIACYGSSVLCWISALGRLPLSVAYPLLSLSYPLVYLGATWLPWFGETLNTQRIAGIALIMLGVALLTWKTNSSAHTAAARTHL